MRRYIVRKTDGKYRQMGRKLDRQKARQKDRQMRRYIVRKTNGKYRQIERKLDRQKARQKEKNIDGKKENPNGLLNKEV